MFEAQAVPGALVFAGSLLGLVCVTALCLCCRRRRRSAMQQEDNALYDQDVFEQSRAFSDSKPTAAFRSKQTCRETPSTSRLSVANRNSDNNWSYQNLPDAENGILEPTYVDPIPNALYANEDEADSPEVDQDSGMGTYGNVFPTKEVDHDSADSSDYENSEMWAKAYEEEPDYVNAE